MTAARLAGEVNPYADTARDYRRAGWRGPLPVPFKEKYPPPVGLTGHAAPLPTDDQIEQWRSRAGSQNICLRLAEVDDDHEVIGIDVDHYSKGNRDKTGFDQLTKLIAELGSLPDTWTATARTDGKSGIRFFRVPSGLAFPGQVDSDIELIRKGHRYAVVWPSVHPDGTEYRWYPPGTEPISNNRGVWDGTVPDAHSLPLLPDSWIDHLTGHRQRTDREHCKDSVSSVGEIEQWADATFYGDDDTQPCGLMRQKLDAAIKKVRESATYHDLLTNAHWNILHLAFEGHHGWCAAINEYEAVLYKTALARGGTTDRTDAELRREIWRPRVEALRKIKGLSDDRIQRGAAPVDASCVTVGCQQNTSNVIDFPNPTTIDSDDQAESSTYTTDVDRELHRLEVRAEAKRRFDAKSIGPLKRSAMSLTTFLSQPPNPTPMRIASLMPDAGRVVFSAPYKAGKTTAVGNLIRALVDGDPFLGAFAVNKPARRLVLIDNELSADMVRDWLLKQGIRNTDAVADVICLRGEVSTFDILNNHRRAEWAKWLRDLGCDYLIFDCLRPVLDALGLDENHDAGKFLTAFDELLAEAHTKGDATIVHHMGHANERSRGDSRIQDWPDAIWKLVRESADDEFSPRYFSATGRDVEVAQGLLDYDPATRHLTYRGTNRSDAQKQRKATAAHTEIIKLLRDDQSNGGNGLSQKKIEDESTKHPNVSRQTVRNALKTGVESGELANWDGPRGAKMYTLGKILDNHA